MNDNRTLPLDCPLREQHNQLKDKVLALNTELIERFGPEAKLDIQLINPESVAYKEVGLRWFIITPIPFTLVDEEAQNQLLGYISDKLISWDRTIDKTRIRYSRQMIAGGVLAYLIGLKEERED